MGRDGCPAVKALDSALRTSIPFLNGTYKEWNGKSLPRLQTAGNPRHQMGICLDIILFCKQGLTPDKSVDWQKEKKLGENLVRAFIDLKDSMKWTEIIFQDRFFWEPEYYTHYAQDQKHFTHIHIDWMTNSLKGKGKTESEIYENSPQNKTTEFKAALAVRLNQINEKWNNNTLDSINLASIVKTFSPDVNPVGEWRVQCDKWTWIYKFDANGNVSWRDPYNNKSGNGKWKVGAGVIQFSWNSGTPESWKLPINPTSQTGSTKMEGKNYTIYAARI